MNKKIISAVALVTILFATVFTGTFVYYNSQIANLKMKISSLQAQIAEKSSINLVTALGVTEIAAEYGLGGIPPYNHLWIDGTVTNQGGGFVYYTGLHVLAYAANGTLEINMTVPINPLNENSQTNTGWYGTDERIYAYLSSYGDYSSYQRGNLRSGETSDVNIHIFHEGIVSNWTITPVWTNSP